MSSTYSSCSRVCGSNKFTFNLDRNSTAKWDELWLL